MADETRLERRLDRVLARATTPRGADVVIATVSTSITIVAGVLMTLADQENFPSIGSGLWWAVQTITTVGYGDHVPTTLGGRLIAGAVMLFGIGFLTVITAAITSTFVSRSRGEQMPSAASTDGGTVPGNERATQTDRGCGHRTPLGMPASAVPVLP